MQVYLEENSIKYSVVSLQMCTRSQDNRSVTLSYFRVVARETVEQFMYMVLSSLEEAWDKYNWYLLLI